MTAAATKAMRLADNPRAGALPALPGYLHAGRRRRRRRLKEGATGDDCREGGGGRRGRRRPNGY